MLNILVFSKQQPAADQPLFDLPGIDVRHQADLEAGPDLRPRFGGSHLQLDPL